MLYTFTNTETGDDVTTDKRKNVVKVAMVSNKGRIGKTSLVNLMLVSPTVNVTSLWSI